VLLLKPAAPGLYAGGGAPLSYAGGGAVDGASALAPFAWPQLPQN